MAGGDHVTPRRFEIAFDEELPKDEVLVAVAPIDSFTGRIVQGHVDVHIEGLYQRPIRNFSGMLVFLKPKTTRADGEETSPQTDQEKYEISVTAEAAGYFDPDPAVFEPPVSDDGSDSTIQRRVDVPLLRLPSFPVPEETTLVSGVIVRGDEPLTGARIWVELPAGLVPRGSASPKPFETRSYRRGAFALALRVPAWEENMDSTVKVVLHVEEGADHRQFELYVQENRRHVFQKPIDITGSNPPELSVR
jgi:hypothetical protein